MLPFESNAFSGSKMFETEDDIWEELLWFVNEKMPELDSLREKDKKGLISIGQEIWLNQFFDANYITEDWMFELVKIVNTSLGADVPISSDMMNCPVRLIDYYSVIKQELIAIERF